MHQGKDQFIHDLIELRELELFPGYYAIGVWLDDGSTMVEKRLLTGSEVEDYLSVSLGPFSANRGEPYRKRGGSGMLRTSGILSDIVRE